MESKKEEFETAVIVSNFSDKRLVLENGQKFLAMKGILKSYRLENSTSEIKFILTNSSVAYDLLKNFEELKISNKNLENIEVQLTMISRNAQISSTTNDFEKKEKKNNKQKFEPKIPSSLKESMQKDDEYYNAPYFHRHFQDISSKAGIISNDSPYITEEQKRRIEEKESRKKDISNVKFTNFLRKPDNNDENIDLQPMGDFYNNFKFRDENKNKWVSKRGFQVY